MIIFMLLFIGISLTILGKEQQPKLIFHLPFDGTAVAAKAAGNAKPIAEKSLRYATGIVGKAVEIKGNAQLSYSTKQNLHQPAGTVMFWFKPNWSLIDFPLTTSNKKDWHCFFAEARPIGKARRGSGALWFWLWGKRLRGDISDKKDTYVTVASPATELEKNYWSHLAFTWDGNGTTIYYNGKQVSLKHRSDKDVQLQLKKNPPLIFNSSRFDRFFVGNMQGKEQLNGWVDEFKIYDGKLTPAAIRAEVVAVQPMILEVNSRYILPGKGEISWSIKNRQAKQSLAGRYLLSVIDAMGNKIIKKNIRIKLAPGAVKTFTTKIPPQTKSGKYLLELKQLNTPAKSTACNAPFHILKKNNPQLGNVGTNLKKKLILSTHIPDLLGSDTFIDYGKTHKTTLNGNEYLEAGTEENDRFAFRVTLPEANRPYLIEWSYPDDKKRTMDVIIQNVQAVDQEYMYQTGVFCGAEYPNTGKMVKFSSIYWARSRDVAFIFMTARDNAPAAVADLKIFKLEGPLPATKVTTAKPINGWTRSLGIYFEDPALNYNFGTGGDLMPEFEQTIDRLIAYMKWNGQNFFAYPAVWYCGMIGKAGYFPREHPNDFIRLILNKFETQQLTFMPTINLHSIPLKTKIAVNAKTFKNGAFHPTAVMIQNNGRPNPGRFHGSPPLFNPLHPETQQYINKCVDNLLDRYADSPAFKGIIFHLTKHTTPWFGTIQAGYNDYNIRQFEQDTKIKVQVSHHAPNRGKLYYEWLMANAKQAWIEWRCQQISIWYKHIAQRLKARRSDLKLGIFSYRPANSELNDKRYATPGSTMAFNREAGFDPKYYLDTPNIIISQTVYPADYRWSEGKRQRKNNPTTSELQHIRYAQADSYALLKDATFSWENIHDRYFESAIGRIKLGQRHWSVKQPKPLKASWLKEARWRVSTLNPGSANYFLEQFLMPLKYSDVLGYSKGGFMIGTLGMETKLRRFAQAYLPLPAIKFTTVYGLGTPLTVRSLKHNGATWFYIVNTAHKATKITITFNQSPGTIKDLATDKQLKLSGKSLTLRLDGLQLRSFKVDKLVKLRIIK
jgi:hypothetical protein